MGGTMFQWKINGLVRSAVLLSLCASFLAGCARLQIPQIDPTGNRIFLPAPSTTRILTPGLARNSAGSAAAAGLQTQPSRPAFAQPSDPESCCNNGPAVRTTPRHQYIIPKPSRYPSRGQTGEIILTPSKIIAPVGSEVVVLAGICGNDSHYVMNQPLEWILGGNSVGQFIEVGGMEHPRFNRLVGPSAKKFDGNYAWGRTGLKNKLLTRGTPTPVDDIELGKGQAYVSLSSASPGTSYVTCVAPKAQAWDKRRKSTVIHWVDALWAIPVPKSATSGTVTPLTTLVTRSTDNNGVPGWKVRYTVVGGAPAEFAPNGSQSVETITNSDGQATVQLRQVAGQFDPGTTQVRVDVIRPALFGESELQVESGITSVVWSAPALTIRAIGPKTAGRDQAFNYRVEVSNPGDQTTRDVVLRTKDFPDSLEFISSSPKPTEFGRILEWRLGDIAPGSQPQVVDIQLKSNTRGNNELCFEVSSQTDQLKTEACAQTEVTVPCIGLQIDGPNAAKVGDQAKFDITVSNQCDERLENVALQIQYDPGLESPLLGNPIRNDIGELGPGESRTRQVVFDVVSAGRHCYNLSVTADGGHVARANECVEAAPTAESTIGFELEGQRRVDRGQNVWVRGTVTNNGNVPLDNVTVTNRFSSSLDPTRVTREFNHRWLGAEGDELIFDVGRLNPGESKVVEIAYEALQEDGNAFSEFTVSSPDISPIAKRYDMRIEIPGTIGGGAGQQPPGDTQPDFQPGGIDPQVQSPPAADEGPIAIPGDTQGSQLNQRRDLEVVARTLDPQIGVGQQSNIEFTVRNGSSVSDRNVNLFLLMPPSIRLVDVVDDLGNQYGIQNRSPDFTRFELAPRQEMRPGDSLKFIVTVEGVQPGEAFVEFQATSENSAGIVAASDAISIRQ